MDENDDTLNLEEEDQDNFFLTENAQKVRNS